MASDIANKITRRDFVKGSLATAAGVGLTSGLTAKVRANVRGANDDIRVAIIGLRIRGAAHVDDFRKIDGVLYRTYN